MTPVPPRMHRGATFLLALAVAGAGWAPVAGADSWRLRWTGPRARADLDHPSAARRSAAARVLGSQGDPVQAVKALMDALEAERDPGVRRSLARSLARRGDPRAVPALVQALEAGEDADRGAVAKALASLRTDTALRVLVEALGEPEKASVASVALRRAGTVAVPHLIGALDDDTTVTQALAVLGDLRDVSVGAAVVPLTRHDEPAVRVAALEVLGRLGDDRAVRDVAARLDDEVDEVRVAALRALGPLGGPAEVPLLARRVRAGSEAERRGALEALVRMDPARAAAPLRAALGTEGPMGAFAKRLVLRWPHPALVPLLEGLLGEEDADAADALARVDGGRGLPSLRRAAEEGAAGPLPRPVVQALAVGIRRWAWAPGVDAAPARAALRGLLDRDDARAWVLGALAGLPEAGDWARNGLASPDAGRRAAAAHALGLLGDAGAGAHVVRAALAEDDPAAFAAMAHAAVTLGARAPLGPLMHRLRHPKMAPDAMVWAARSWGDALPPHRRALRELLRRRLRAEAPRQRAAAARALAEARDVSAWRALVQRLDDSAPEVRLAAARALEALAPAAAVLALEARERVEDDRWVRHALQDAARARARRPVEAFGARGLEVLRVRIAAEDDGAYVNVDVILPDGRWLRLPSLGTGELFLADLPAGTVDVRVRVG